MCARKQLSLYEWLNQSFKPYYQKLVNVPISQSLKKNSWEDCQPLQKIIQKIELEMGKEGRLLIVEKCEQNWCKITSEEFEGWIKTDNIWGLN